MSAPLLLKYSLFFSCIQVSRFQTSRLQTSIVQSPSVQASRVQEIIAELLRHPLREKCMYSELFWSSFSYIWTKYGEILHISPHSVRMRKNTDQNNSKYRYFLTQWPRIQGSRDQAFERPESNCPDHASRFKLFQFVYWDVQFAFRNKSNFDFISVHWIFEIICKSSIPNALRMFKMLFENTLTKRSRYYLNISKEVELRILKSRFFHSPITDRKEEFPKKICLASIFMKLISLRDPGPRDPRTWDPGPPSKFKSGAQDPVKFKSGTPFQI